MIDTSDLDLGQFVISKAGRDKNRMFIIYNIVDDKFVTVVDGNLRKIGSPKKKNIKHLLKINEISDRLNRRLSESETITNLMVRREIEKLEEILNRRDIING